MVDLFMYRDPDATKEQDKAEVVDEAEAEEANEPEQVVGGASPSSLEKMVRMTMMKLRASPSLMLKRLRSSTLPEQLETQRY